MQAWSQWFFCSWHGLCLIGIGHAEWSSGEGYGNAPTESIKWGDTLRPYDGQRINESQRKGSREERSTDRGWWNEHIFQENTLYTSLCLSGLKEKMEKTQMCQPRFGNSHLKKKKKKKRGALNKYVCVQKWLLISWHAFSAVRNVGSLWPGCDSDTSHYQQAPQCDVWITNPASSIAP